MNVTAEQEAAVDLVRAKNRPVRDRSHMGALSIYGNLDASDLWPMPVDGSPQLVPDVFMKGYICALFHFETFRNHVRFN